MKHEHQNEDNNIAVDLQKYSVKTVLSKTTNDMLKDHKWGGQKPQMTRSKAINGKNEEDISLYEPTAIFLVKLNTQ